MKKSLFPLFIGIFIIGQLPKIEAQNGVGVNTTSPKSSFEINGSFGQNVTTITTNTTLDATQGLILCNNGSTAITVTLPTVSGCTGRIYNIKRETSSTANVTIAGTIDGAVNLILKNPGESVTIFSNGTEWKTMLNYYSSNTNSSAWTTVGNAATNPATNFIGTTDNQDFITKTNGISRIKTTASGVTNIGDIAGGNYTAFEADGTMSFNGNATVYDDLTVPGTTVRNSGTSVPTFAVYKDGVFLNFFDPSAINQVYFTVQLPHSWKEGSDLKAHVHWVPTSDASSTNVTWCLEYTWCNIGGTFSNTSTICSSTLSVGSPATKDKQVLTNLGTISGSGKTLSGILICRFYRDAANSSDTFTGNAGLLQIDFHFEKDTEGSRQEFIK